MLLFRLRLIYACRRHFPLLNPASKHDSLGFLETWFRMKAFLPDLHVSKWLLDSAHDAMPYYIYCRKNHIQPFIDLNVKRGIKVKYKNDFTIGEDGVPVCKAGRKMRHDGSEPSKKRLKFRCPLASRLWPAGNTAAPAHIPARIPSMAGQSIWL